MVMGFICKLLTIEKNIFITKEADDEKPEYDNE